MCNKSGIAQAMQERDLRDQLSSTRYYFTKSVFNGGFYQLYRKQEKGRPVFVGKRRNWNDFVKMVNKAVFF